MTMIVVVMRFHHNILQNSANIDNSPFLWRYDLNNPALESPTLDFAHISLKVLKLLHSRSKDWNTSCCQRFVFRAQISTSG